MVMIFKSNDVDKKQNYHLYSDPALWILNLSYIFILFYLYTLPQTMSVIFFRRFCPGCKNIVNIPIKGRSKTLKTRDVNRRNCQKSIQKNLNRLLFFQVEQKLYFIFDTVFINPVIFSRIQPITISFFGNRFFRFLFFSKQLIEKTISV